jgi:hypothetical protein
LWGPKSAAAFKALSKRLHLNMNMAYDMSTWIKFLQLTAIQGMRVQ